MELIGFLAGHPAWAIAGAGLLGLFVGSFLNVVILRLPPRLMHEFRAEARELLELEPPTDDKRPADLVVTRSHCPKCGHAISWWENIPVLSFVLLRGRCRGCGTGISWQYPSVEILTGVMSAVVLWRYGWSLESAVLLPATWFLIAGSGIDLHTTLLPDQLTLPLMWLGLLSAVFGLFQTPDMAIFGAAVGYLSLWSVYWVFKLLTGKEGMGYGDFKLLAALGAFTGIGGILPIVLLSSLFGAIVGGAWLMMRGRDRATPIPFGPFLAAAGWTQWMFGDWINSLILGHGAA